MSNEGDKMLAPLRALISATDFPALSPAEAHKRLNFLCTSSESEAHDFRNGKNRHDAAAVLEDCHLRTIIAADDLEKEVHRIWNDLFPQQRNADMATIRAHLTEGNS